MSNFSGRSCLRCIFQRPKRDPWVLCEVRRWVLEDQGESIFEAELNCTANGVTWSEGGRNQIEAARLFWRPRPDWLGPRERYTGFRPDDPDYYDPEP